MDQLSKERLTIRVDEVDSTNLMLKKIAREEHPEEGGSVVIAGYQTGGAWTNGYIMVFLERRKLVVQPPDISKKRGG